MKKLIAHTLVLVIVAAMAFGLGGLSVIHSEGWVDGDTFVVDWMNNAWAWDISEGQCP